MKRRATSRPVADEGDAQRWKWRTWKWRTWFRCLNRSDDTEHCRMHGIVPETFAIFYIHILDVFVDTLYSCVLVLGYAFQLFYNYRRSIQLTALPWLVFCRCFENNCTLHCNVIYFQTIYILSSNFMSVIFSQPLMKKMKFDAAAAAAAARVYSGVSLLRTHAPVTCNHCKPI